jgi:hypothetical protein
LFDAPLWPFEDDLSSVLEPEPLDPFEFEEDLSSPFVDGCEPPLEFELLCEAWLLGPWPPFCCCAWSSLPPFLSAVTLPDCDVES